MKLAKKVLIVDDDPAVVDVLKRRVEKDRFVCLTAATASDGLKKALHHKPDFILLDLMLPQMSGFGFLRELKKHPELSEVPVVVLSGLGDEEVAQESMDLGAVGYLTKDCDHRELMTLVQEYAVQPQIR